MRRTLTTLMVVFCLASCSAAADDPDFIACTRPSQIDAETRMAACNRAIGDKSPSLALVDAYVTRANIYSMQSKYSEAIAEFDTAIALKPDYAPFYGQRGFQYSLLGQKDRALEEYQKGLALDPKNVDILFVRALTYSGKGDEAAAFADFDKIIELAPGSKTAVAAFNSKADAYLKKKDTEKALAVLADGIAVKPDYVWFYSTRAKVYHELKDSEKELADINHMLELDSNNKPALMARAWFYDEQGKFDLSIADYQTLMRLDPNDKYYRTRLADLQRKAGMSPSPSASASDTEQAKWDCWGEQGRLIDEKDTKARIEACDRVIATEGASVDDKAKSYVSRARALLDDSHYVDAANALSEAIALKPDDADLYRKRGWARHWGDDHDGAIADFEHILASNANDEDALDGRSRGLFDKGDTKGALADLGKLIALKPDDKDAYVKRAEMLLKQEDFAGALTDLNKAIAIEPTLYSLYIDRAAAYQGMGDSDKALDDLSHAIEIDPKAASGLFDRALLNEKIGKLEPAIADYDRLIALGESVDYYTRRRADVVAKLGKPVPPPPEVSPAASSIEAGPAASSERSAAEPEVKTEGNCSFFSATANAIIAIPCPP